MRTPIYLDYAATAPVDPRVAEKMYDCLTLEGNFGNPASRSHKYGWLAEEAVEIARGQVADLINADPREIVITSGATESDNLALKGAAHYLSSEQGGAKGKHLITSAYEHKAVLDSCKALEAEGFEITYIKPTSDGLISVEDISAAIRPDTLLVSVMHVNNELGTINDIAAIGQLCRSRSVLFHVDAAQSVGKIPVDVKSMNVDLMSISAHKLYGPKGIGCLFVRRDPSVKILAQIHGGGHERGMRSGTLATHQIVGMGEAAAIASRELTQEMEYLTGLRNKLWHGFQALDCVSVNGTLDRHIPGILNVSFSGVDGETLLMSLHDIAVSTGSACTSATVEPSYVLKTLGLNDELAHASIRFSIGRFTTEEEIDYTVNKVVEVVSRLKS
ncbi:IscS subfamily cysteine desulfurase [Litoribrevibacter albus]|uniref:Cysteine desulfurase IscS n=1 Tax=Litoribrevibacter albus TaxID=1473156 RepID=A0AA37SBE6_9GAMM|nr:IscS subfamily cysteine desulfurase [Litoribrevibacter albus]GLQ32034.1 cysteine desulfurase IscS [Litoribrevibacter albus]